MALYTHTTRGCWLASLWRDDELYDLDYLKNVADVPTRIYHLGRDEEYALHARLICAGVPHTFDKIEPGVWVPMRPADRDNYFGLTFSPRKLLTSRNPYTNGYDLRVEL